MDIVEKFRLADELIVSDMELKADGHVYWTVAKPGRKMDEPIGTDDGRGYLNICFNHNGKKYRIRLHHLVWRLSTGAWPTKSLDHINRNRADNRIENLREVTCQENHLNKGVQNNNKLGFQNIRVNASGSYRVQIMFHGKNVTSRSFSNLNDAIAHRDSIRSQFGFSPATDRHSLIAAAE